VYRDKRKTAGTSDNPREEHFTAWLFTYLSSVPQLQSPWYAAPLSASALDTTTKSSIVIINGRRCNKGNCYLYVTLRCSFVAIAAVSIKGLYCFYTKFGINFIFQINELLEGPYIIHDASKYLFY
jgi:hypothetical protein